SCVCTNGTVQCQHRPCPFASCSNPITRDCCRSCEGCLYRGEEYPDSFEFSNANDPCSVCYCYGGEVVCTRIPCYEECSHPYTAPGQCCAQCDRKFTFGQIPFNIPLLSNVPDRENPCSQCTCQVSAPDTDSLLQSLFQVCFIIL
uniref:VWFC domain-containing protein n=1 Tax=Neogobius melanostomus TaxID=47308 RepID=A0A8C6WIJ8_9GOBI